MKTILLDTLAITTLLAGAAIISIASPALYVLLCLAAALVGIGYVAFKVTVGLLESDCPLDNVLGVQAVVSLIGLLCSLDN
jgi:hypothetical protein